MFSRVFTGVLLSSIAPLVLADGPVQEMVGAIQDAIQTGDLDKASDSLRAALEQYPREAGLYNLRGIIHARRDEVAAARADFESAVRLDSRLTPAWQNLARACQMLTGADPAAGSCAKDGWERVLRQRPGDPEALFSLATIHEWNGNFAASLRSLERLPAEESSRARVLALRCADLAGLGRLDEARQSAIRLAEAPDFTDADAEAVFPVLKTAKTAPVLAALLEALDARKLAPPRRLQQLAVAYEQLQRPADARRILERVAAAEPNDARHLIELARLAYGSRDREGALGYLAHARDLTPNDPRVHFLFGLITVEMDLPMEARRSLERALALDPENARYNYALGAVALNTREASRAIPYFEKYVSAQPRDPSGHFALGVACFAAGDYTRARQEMDGVSAHPRTAAGAEYFLGRIARVEEKLDEAAGHLERSIRLLPSFAESRAELGRVRLRQNRMDQARAELVRALAIDPDSFQANSHLLALYQRTHDSRAEQQAERVRKLDAQRSARQELMLRTIEVKPY